MLSPIQPSTPNDVNPVTDTTSELNASDLSAVQNLQFRKTITKVKFSDEVELSRTWDQLFTCSSCGDSANIMSRY